MVPLLPPPVVRADSRARDGVVRQAMADARSPQHHEEVSEHRLREAVMGLESGLGEALRTDYFLLREEFSPAQLGYLERTRQFVHDEVLPVINGYWERAEFPWPLVKKLGAAGLVGDGIAGDGCPEMDPLSAGLVTMELNRGDGSLGTFLGVQAGLAMRSIAMLGSQEQMRRWLPGLARADLLGAFCADRAGATARTRWPWRPPPGATATRGSWTGRRSGSATAPWPT